MTGGGLTVLVTDAERTSAKAYACRMGHGRKPQNMT
jgi:hypothetical protein